MNDVATYPELVFGLVGPIGSDIEGVQKALCDALKEVDYQPYVITLSGRMADLLIYKGEDDIDLSTLEKKIDAGNRVRRAFKRKGILAVEAVRAIREFRKQEVKKRGYPLPTHDDTGEEINPSDNHASRTAYIIRQLKNEDERRLLVDIYGKQFIQVSIAQDHDGRLEKIRQITRSEQPGLHNDEVDEVARRLVRRDEHEEDDRYGQQLGSIFHLGDLFVNASSEESISETTRRFVRAFFGRTNIAPTRDEFGSYMAKAASLRSVDLSRQVGAALTSDDGDVVAIGCNEVPKAGGGNYWDEDADKARDVDRGIEANKQEMNRIVHDFLAVLKEQGVLAFDEDQGPEQILSSGDVKSAIEESLIGEITEYGRMVHAEMNALCDAARLGRRTKGTTLYVTTYPCHNCAKHIIASGIERVVFIEPYPKSRAELLYSDAIARNRCAGSGVLFEHFSGISPRRYRDIFEKEGKRRDGHRVYDWHSDKCMPRIFHHKADYIASENQCILDNFPELADD